MGTLLEHLPKPDQALTLLRKIASRPSNRSCASIIGNLLSSPSSFQTIQVPWVWFSLISYGTVRQNHVSMTDVTSQECVSLQDHLSFGRSATLTAVDLDSGQQIPSTQARVCCRYIPSRGRCHVRHASRSMPFFVVDRSLSQHSVLPVPIARP